MSASVAAMGSLGLLPALAEREVLSFLNFESGDFEEDYYDHDSLPMSDESEEYTPDSSAFSSPLPEPIDEAEFPDEMADDSTTGAGAVFYFDVPHSVYVDLEPGSDDSRYGDLEEEDDEDEDENDVHMPTHMYEYGDSYLVVVQSPATAAQSAPVADLSTVEVLPTTVIGHDEPCTPRKRRFSESSVEEADSTSFDSSVDDDLPTASPTPVPSSPERKRSRIDDRLSLLIDSGRGSAATLRSVARLIGAASATRDALLAVDLSALSQATLLTLHEMVEGALREQPDDHQNRRRRSRKHTTRRKTGGSPSKRSASDGVVVVETTAVTMLLDDEDEDDEIDVVNM